jgi:hypothetical protein
MIAPWSIWLTKHKGRWPGCNVFQVVQLAYKEGRLAVQPCSICGDPQGHGHHPDYAKPFDVIYLCHRHHMQLHHRLNLRWRELDSKRYTLRFHNRALAEIHREYSEPYLPLFSRTNKPAA